jgi:hypothetical protein
VKLLQGAADAAVINADFGGKLALVQAAKHGVTEMLRQDQEHLERGGRGGFASDLRNGLVKGGVERHAVAPAGVALVADGEALAALRRNRDYTLSRHSAPCAK